MKKVLIISYFYPPLGGPGALRILSFTKYLQEYGWKPYVITIKNPDRYFNIIGKEKVPEDIKVVHTKNILPLGWAQLGMEKYFGIKNFYSFPDIYIGWLIPTVLKAKKIIEKENIDLIFVSSSPWTSSLIGVLLKKLTKKPLVIEFRDPWNFNPSIEYPTRIHNILNTKMEKNSLTKCDFFITVTEGLLNAYNKKYSFLKEKSGLVYNGVDIEKIPQETRKDERFTIIYPGTIYNFHVLDKFLEAAKTCIENKAIPKENIRILIIGYRKKRLDFFIKKYNAILNITLYNYSTYKKTMEHIFNSNLLLLIINFKSKIKEYKYFLTTKIFDYLASGSPILALILEGEAAQMIRKYSDNSYIISDYDNIDKIAEAIYDCYTKWKEGKLNKKISKKTIEFRKKFNREEETKQLAEIFDRVLER